MHSKICTNVILEEVLLFYSNIKLLLTTFLICLVTETGSLNGCMFVVRSEMVVIDAV